MKTRFALLLVWLFTAMACLGQVNLIVAPSGTLTVRTNLAVPLGQIGLVDVTLTSSSATPEGAVTANPGSIHFRRDTGDWYRKVSGTSNTGWALQAASVGDNWVASGTTNSVLAGTGLLYNLVATNDITLGAKLIFSPGATNLLYRLDTDLVYSNAIASSTGPYIQIWDGLGNAGKVGVAGNIVQLKTDGSAVGVELMDDSSRSVRWFANGLVPTQSNSSMGSSVNPWQDIYLNRNIVWNGTTNTVWDFAGTGSPAGIVAAGVGSIYRRYDGGTATSVYIKEIGVGNTGWVAIGGGGAPTTSQYLTLASDAGLSAERILTGTANQIILTDSGADAALTLSTPQNIATTSTPQFARLGIGAAAPATSGIGLPDGTATNPSIGFTSNDDGTGTGIYRYGSNEIGMTCNGSVAFRFAASSSGITILSSTGTLNFTSDTSIARDGAANILQLGTDSATAVPVNFKGPDGVGTDKVGGALVLSGGKSTGAGPEGAVRLQTSPSGATGSTANTLIDRYIVAPSKTLTDAATSLFEIALPTLKSTGGRISWNIVVSDGTDVQAYSGMTFYAAVNKAGVYTKTVSTTTADSEAKAVSAGTLTTVFSLLDGTNKLTLQVTPTGSLTETTYQIYYTVENNSPQAITLL